MGTLNHKSELKQSKISSITILFAAMIILGGISSVNASHEESLEVTEPQKESEKSQGIPEPQEESEESVNDTSTDDDIIQDLLVSQAEFFDSIFSNQDDEDSLQCDWFKITEGCDFPSGLDILISIFIGVYLAIVIHMMARHQQEKLEHNSDIIQKNTERLENMLKTQENMRNRRRNFAIHSFKNHLDNLLSTMSSINESVTKFTEEKNSKSFLAGVQTTSIRAQLKREEEIKQRITQTLRNTIIYASDALDPVLVSHIDELCSVVAQTYVTESDGVMTFAGFGEAKKMIVEASQIIGMIDEEIEHSESKKDDKFSL